MAANHELTLDNGLTFLSSRLEHLHSIEMGFYFKAGALYENRRNQGISHLIEHLCFRNLNGLTQGQLYQALDNMGASLQGTTYLEAMVFRLKIAPRFFDAALMLLTRLFLPGKWTGEEIAREKQVVLRQIEGREQDFWQEANTHYWRTVSGAFPLMGTEKSVEAMSESTIHQWKKKIFQPQNACFALAGNFSLGMEEAAKAVLGELSNTTPEPPFAQQVPIDFCMRDQKNDLLLNSDWDKAQVQLSFDINDDLVFPLCADVLNHMVGGGDSSALFMELRESLALTDEIFSAIEEVGLFRRMVIEYTVSHERLLESLSRAFEILARFCQHVGARQMDRTRVFFTTNLTFQLDQAGAMNELMGWSWLSQDGTEADLETREQMYRDITCEDLLDAAQAIFRNENLCCHIIKNPQKISAKALKETIAKCRGMLL